MIKESNAAILSLGGVNYLSQVQIHWETEQVLNTRRFKIYRGIASDKIDEEIGFVDTVPGIRIYSYVDYTAELGDLYRPYYYRIDTFKVLPDDTEQFELSGEMFTWDNRLRVWEEDVIYRHDLLFHYDAGSPLLFYSERTDTSDVHCPKCWDISTSLPRPPRGGCPVCMDTGRQRPYLDPIIIWAEFGIKSRILEHNLVELQPGQKHMTFGGIPKMKPGDVILEPFKHELWTVEVVNLIGRDTAPVVQQCSLSLVDKSESKYKYLNIAPETLELLNVELNSINNERRF